MKLPSDVKRFIILVFLLGWLLTIPLWKHPAKLGHPMSGIIILFFMYTPALSALYMSYINSEPDKKQLFAFQLGNNWKRHWLLQWCMWPIICFCSLCIADLLGLYSLDLSCSGFAAWLSNSLNNVADVNEQPIFNLPLTYQQMVYSYLALLIISPLIVGIVSFGQELAWRGWLLSKLMLFGPTKAILYSGVIWGVWYTPLIALGHHYPEHPIIGIFLTLIYCVGIGVILSWSRLRTDSIWPATIGHAAITSSAPIAHLFFEEGTEVEATLVGLTGITGWIIPFAMAIILFRSNQLQPLRPFIEQRR